MDSLHFTGKNRPKVVILCGGQGTRLREETEFKPKPLVEIGGLPILWHIMKHYSTSGHNDFVLCLGYKGRMIKEFFMDYEWDAFDFSMNLRQKSHMYHRTHEIEDWNITFANTGEKTLTAGRIKAIEKYIPIDHKYFLLTYGDGVANVDINALIAFHEAQRKLVTITGVHPMGKYGILDVNAKSEITNFAEKPPSDDFINGGFMVVDRRVFQTILHDGPFEVDILPALAKEGQLALFPHNGFWHAMDTYKDYQDLNAMWEKGAPWKTWEHHPKRMS
jgi:glucose-1-phosphate cytidylyltransferase